MARTGLIPTRFRAGVSLAELIVALAIVLIVTAIVLSVLSKVFRVVDSLRG